MELLHQLAGLLLGAIPTVLLLLLVYFAYRRLVHKPLEAVLAERHRRTEGAIEKSRADIAAAEARTAEYEQRLREARMAIFKQQEARRQQALQARAAAAAEARAQAQKMVQQTRDAIAQDVAQVRDGLRGDAERLAEQIIRTILRPVQVAETPAAGGRS